MKVRNKVIVITGGGNGIGRELVLNLLSKGAHVAAVDINAAALQETVGLAGVMKDKLSTHVVNITDKDAVAALPEQVITKHGTVDGVINNAGIIQHFVRVNDLDYADIERVMNVNFYGTLYMKKAFLPHFLTRPEAHITNISSMGGFLLAAVKERAKLADKDDGTRSNILVNKKGAMICPFVVDQMNVRMAVRSHARCLYRPSHRTGRYRVLHASVP